MSWWEEETPSKEEKIEGMLNLLEHNYVVDHVITHTSPESIIDEYIEFVEGYAFNVDNSTEKSTEKYLEKVKDMIEYEHWWFGHFHDDIDIDERHTLVYERIIPLNR